MTDDSIARIRRRAADEFDAAEHTYRERRRTAAARTPRRDRIVEPDAPLPRLRVPAVRRAH